MSQAPDERPPSITVRLKPSDVTAWLHYQRWAAPGAGQRFWTVLAVTLAVPVILCLLGAMPYHWPVGSAAALGVFIGVCAFPWRHWLGAPLDARRLCREDPALLRERSFTAGPDGLEIEDRGDRILLHWPAFSGLIDADQHLFFVDFFGTAFILPRRYFPSPSASQQFFTRCQQYVAAAGEHAGGPLQTIAFGARQVSVTFTLKAEDMATARSAAVRLRVHELFYKANTDPNVIGTALAVVLFVAIIIWRSVGPLGLLVATPAMFAGTWYGLQAWVSRQLGRPVQAVGEQEVAIAPLGVSLAVGRHPHHFYAWDEIQGVTRRAGFLLLRGHMPSLFIAVPEKALGGPVQADEFVAKALEWKRDAGR